MSTRETDVRCPRCQGLFPHSEIEPHIAEAHTSRPTALYLTAYVFLAAAYVFLAAAFTTLVLLYQRAPR